MKFIHLDLMVGCNFLFQFAIVTNVLHTSDCVTFHLSTDKVKGNKLDEKCKETGQIGVARVMDSTSLNKVKKAIEDRDISDNQEYWTGLSWQGGNYYWDHDKKKKAYVNNNIVTNPTGNNGWHCFTVAANRNTLKPKKCDDEQLFYICEKDDPLVDSLTSSELPLMVTKLVSTQLNTTMRIEPTSTWTLKPTTNEGRKLTALATSTTSETVAAATSTVIMRSSGLLTPILTSTLISNKIFTSNILTTAITSNMAKTSIITLTSSITDGSNASTTTKKKQTAKEKLRQYFLDIRALNVNKTESLQDAANITSRLFKDLMKDHPKKRDINILVATQELESFAINYGRFHYKANESKIFAQDLFAMKIQKISVNNKDAVSFTANETDYSAGEESASISLPSRIFKGRDAVVVSILYNGIKQWIPDEKQLKLDGKTFRELELRSRIIASTVYPRPTSILQENVTISFICNKELKDDEKPHCVFWDFTAKSKLNGSWSITGCTLVRNVNKEITCSCNHLTNFAILMQVGDSKIPSDHKVALNVITYVGCALSLVGEVLTVIAYCALMNLKQEQIQIRFNLVVAIAIAQITFLAGIDASETKGVCVFVAAMIHYFYLAGFAWMLFEGIYLYLMVVKVFNTVVRMRLLYAVAWGLSLLIVVLSIMIAFIQDGGVQSYVPGDFCWVSFTNNLIWTFVTPVLVVCLINSVILGRVVHEILKMQADKSSDLERIRQGGKACVVLFPLLGMTWVFGVLSVTDAGLAFQYIFTILNSLQGLFIFILHVLRNGDVRAAYSRKKQKWKEARSVGASHTNYHNSIDMWSSKVTNETEESRKRSMNATPWSPVGYGSRVALQEKRSMTPVDT